jgi:hypothetical protein
MVPTLRLLGAGIGLLGGVALAAETTMEAAMTLTTDSIRLVIDSAGRTAVFADTAGTNYAATPLAPFARVTKAGKACAATGARLADGVLRLEFAEAGASADLRLSPGTGTILIEVVALTGDGIEELAFVDIPLTLKGTPGESLAACCLALNLQTKVRDIPQASSHLWAACYPRFGFVGAKAALIASPPADLRQVLQRAVSEAPDLPHSPIGGPWALDGADNRRSYLFDFGELTEATVDEWIALAQRLGITQIDFHGGRSFRFGDCQPAPDLFPRGVDSMKAVIDKLHAAGIQAGLHTYAMFMAKTCPWVTPVPDPRLGSDATLTLAADLTPEATELRVVEPTAGMSTVTGFFVRNSVTFRIDEELITYGEVATAPPYGLTKCQRGAFGTRPAAHAKGAKAYHLRECFGLFVADGDSTLFSETAAKTAELFNAAGFDMIYLDALDGGDTVAGREVSWHYESKFVFEIWKRLQRPAIMEMSTFHHHLWYVRSRMGAWDHPNRSHKRFIDLHCQSNAVLLRQFLPGHLGWWSFKTWQGLSGEPTHSDDIEYLCGKAMANDCGLSIMGISPATVTQVPALPRLAEIVRNYETLRQGRYFADSVKETLRAPGAEFTLFQNAAGAWQFRPVEIRKQKVVGLEGGSSTWTLGNRFAAQPLCVRIEALMAAGPYAADGNPVLADFTAPDAFPQRACQAGVSATLEAVADPVKVGPVSARLSAVNATATPVRTWCKFGRTFAPPLDLSRHQALGLWVHGDGSGAVLNLQQTSPEHLSGAIADHYVVLDFKGWRYVELIEPEGERYADYAWPYGNGYSIYRESILPQCVESLSLWLNHVPANGSAVCHLSPIRALPAIATTFKRPAITLGGQTITFPVDIATGQYLEYRGPGDCRLYGQRGEELASVIPEGEAPTLNPGDNQVRFTCEPQPGVTPRAYVTVFAQGEPFGERRP